MVQNNFNTQELSSGLGVNLRRCSRRCRPISRAELTARRIILQARISSCRWNRYNPYTNLSDCVARVRGGFYCDRYECKLLNSNCFPLTSVQELLHASKERFTHLTVLAFFNRERSRKNNSHDQVVIVHSIIGAWSCISKSFRCLN